MQLQNDYFQFSEKSRLICSVFLKSIISTSMMKIILVACVFFLFHPYLAFSDIIWFFLVQGGRGKRTMNVMTIEVQATGFELVNFWFFRFLGNVLTCPASQSLLFLHLLAFASSSRFGVQAIAFSVLNLLFYFTFFCNFLLFYFI